MPKIRKVARGVRPSDIIEAMQQVAEFRMRPQYNFNGTQTILKAFPTGQKIADRKPAVVAHDHYQLKLSFEDKAVES